MKIEEIPLYGEAVDAFLKHDLERLKKIDARVYDSDFKSFINALQNGVYTVRRINGRIEANEPALKCLIETYKAGE